MAYNRPYLANGVGIPKPGILEYVQQYSTLGEMAELSTEAHIAAVNGYMLTKHKNATRVNYQKAVGAIAGSDKISVAELLRAITRINADDDLSETMADEKNAGDYVEKKAREWRKAPNDHIATEEEAKMVRDWKTVNARTVGAATEADDDAE